MTPTIAKAGTPAPPAKTASSIRILLKRNPESLSSEPFEILAQSGKRFFVHSDILTAQSQLLRSAITGVWGETIEKKIDLSDWDDDTVARFVEFLYYGDYQVPEPTPENCGGADGMNVLLVHAKVYALAQYKTVWGLKVMALDRLKTALEEIDDLRTASVSANVIELLGYVYSCTNLADSDEPMRDLISTFTAKSLEKMNRQEIGVLLRRGGDFAAELMQKVADRLFDMGWEAKTSELLVALSHEEVRRLKATNVRLQRSEAANKKEMEEMKDRVSWLEHKVKWFEDICPEKAKKYEKWRKDWSNKHSNYTLKQLE